MEPPTFPPNSSWRPYKAVRSSPSSEEKQRHFDGAVLQVCSTRASMTENAGQTLRREPVKEREEEGLCCSGRG